MNVLFVLVITCFIILAIILAAFAGLMLSSVLFACRSFFFLIMCAIERHPESSTRDSLTHTLFNLIKRPDEQQRRIIMDVSFAKAQLFVSYTWA